MQLAKPANKALVLYVIELTLSAEEDDFVLKQEASNCRYDLARQIARKLDTTNFSNDACRQFYYTMLVDQNDLAHGSILQAVRTELFGCDVKIYHRMMLKHSRWLVFDHHQFPYRLQVTSLRLLPHLSIFVG